MGKIDFEINNETGCFICISHAPGKRGYPRSGRGAKTRPLHRLVYEFYNGKITKKLKQQKIMVLHSCDNKMCINPKHLRLGTVVKDNAKDAKINNRIPRGENRSNAKLSRESIIIIRDMYENQGLSQRDIAKFFEVSSGCISDIIRGKSWFHVTDGVSVVRK